MFRFGQTNAVIGLDIGSHAVKAVALQANKERVTLAGYAQARIDNQDIGEVVKRVMDTLGVKSRRVVTSVSGRSVIVRQLELPKMEQAQLNQKVLEEADKYIPFGAEEVIIDAQPLGKAEEKAATMPVMLVAVRKSFVTEHIAIARAGGVQPEIVDVDVFALANAYELLGPAQPPASEKKATALIDIGASKSNIAIVQEGKVLFTREVYLAGNEVSEAVGRTLGQTPQDVDLIKLQPGDMLDQLLDAATPAIEDLANEIRLSFDYVEGQFDVEVSGVVLCGGTALLPNLPAALGNILGRPVHVFDPLAGVDLVPSKYDIHGLDANSPSLAIALGLAAHVLAFPQAGLGGAQSHQWQPRSQRGDGTAPPPAPAEAPAEAPVAPAPVTVNTAISPTPMPPPSFAPAPSFATPPPPPPQFTPPAPLGAAPPLAAAMAPPTAIIAPPPSLDPISDAIPAPPRETARSGLLVVLDDDQEMPPLASERITKGQKPPTSRMVKLDSLAQDDDQKDEDPGLPPLPKI